jgi:hypothetical protein
MWEILGKNRLSGVLQPEDTLRLGCANIHDHENGVRRFVDWDRVRGMLGSNDADPLPVPVVDDIFPAPKMEGFRLIDVYKSCSPGCKYVTLSYVWGKGLSNGFQATLNKIETLQQPDGFKSVDLPATLSDAIAAYEKLEFQYL